MSCRYQRGATNNGDNTALPSHAPVSRSSVQATAPTCLGERPCGRPKDQRKLYRLSIASPVHPNKTFGKARRADLIGVASSKGCTINPKQSAQYACRRDTHSSQEAHIVHFCSSIVPLPLGTGLPEVPFVVHTSGRGEFKIIFWRFFSGYP